MPELAIYSYRIIKLDLAAGLTDFELVTDGRKITYSTPSDGPEIQIRLQLKANDQIPLRPQGTINAPFQRLYVSAAAIAKNIYILVSSPDVSLESRDVNVNQIALVNSLTSITDPVTCKEYTFDRAVNGQIFERASYISNLAGNYSLFQIYNPVGSGKTLIVLGLRYQTDAGIGWRVRIQQYNTQLTTNIGTLYNVQSGGSPSSATFRSEQPSSFPAGNVLDEYNGPGNYDVANQFRPRFDVLAEGKGLLVGSIAVNCSSSCSIRALEI